MTTELTVTGRVVPFHVTARVDDHAVSFALNAFAYAIKRGELVDARIDHGRFSIGSERGSTFRLWQQPDGLYASLLVTSLDWQSVIERHAAKGLPGWSIAWSWSDVRYIAEPGHRRIVHVFGIDEVSLCLGMTPRFAGTFAHITRATRAA